MGEQGKSASQKVPRRMHRFPTVIAALGVCVFCMSRLTCCGRPRRNLSEGFGVPWQKPGVPTRSTSRSRLSCSACSTFATRVVRVCDAARAPSTSRRGGALGLLNQAHINEHSVFGKPSPSIYPPAAWQRVSCVRFTCASISCSLRRTVSIVGRRTSRTTDSRRNRRHCFSRSFVK